MHAFVSLPFEEAFDLVFETISKVVTLRGLEAIRAEQADLHAMPSVRAAVERDILSSRFMIADLTGSHPNVLQEVRYASELGKPRIFISQEPPEQARLNTQGLNIHPYDPYDLDALHDLLLNLVMNPSGSEVIHFDETLFHGPISAKIGLTNAVPGQWRNPFTNQE